MKKQNPSFSHFYHKNDGKLSLITKKVIFVFFGLFLLCYQHHGWYELSQKPADSILHYLFDLFFQLFNRTLIWIHESGHGICYLLPYPKLFMVLNGTLFQLGFPLGVWYYYKQRENGFAAFITLFFVGLSLQYTAWYISTAGEGLHVPAHKSFLGFAGLHDFNYLLDTIGILAYYEVIAVLVKGFAYVTMIWAVVSMFHDTFSKDVSTTRSSND